jgi:hypothetical protein
VCALDFHVANDYFFKKIWKLKWTFQDIKGFSNNMNIHIQISMIASIGLVITYIHIINSLLEFYLFIL